MTHGSWRTPSVVLVCGGIIMTIALGTRHNFGLYLQPMTMDLGIGRAFSAEKRTTALGVAGAAGSFGQFVMLPYGQVLINSIGWQQALLALAITLVLIAPLSAALVEDKKAQAQIFHKQSIPEALREAFGHQGYLLLCAGYTVCGFQIMFISVHFPAYLADQRMSPETGMMALALIGLFNILGSYVWGWLGGRHAKKYLLAALYFTRSAAIAVFILLPVTPASVYVFAAVIGFLWLGTVPLTSGVIAQVFGVKYMATLSGISFFCHQIGSFIGVWLAGYLFDATGSYQLMWVLTIAMGVVSAIVNLPIDERPLLRPAIKPA